MMESFYELHEWGDSLIDEAMYGDHTKLGKVWRYLLGYLVMIINDIAIVVGWNLIIIAVVWTIVSKFCKSTDEEEEE